MRNLCPLCGVLLLFCLPSLLQGQVMNIEKSRIQTADSIGWAGDMSMGFSVNRNTKTLLTVNGTSHLQYKNRKDLYLLLGRADFVKVDTQQFANSTFLHLRYNRKWNTWLRWEVFGQIQRNMITRIRMRMLLGTGPRFKIANTPKWALYTGTLYVWEYNEELTASSEILSLRQHRMSGYASLTFHPISQIEFLSTLYLQPRIDAPQDYRILLDASLTCKVVKRFSVGILYNLLYDSQPAHLVPTTLYTLSNRVSWNF